MKLNHKFVVPAAFDVAWAAFNDLDGLVPCVPGASLVSAEGDSFAGEVKVKLGPISMTYSGTGTFIERDKAAGRMVVEAKGKDKRGNGTAGATVIAQMTPEGTGTAVEVTTDLAVTGKPAQFGRGVIQDVSDKLLGQFVDCISAKLSPATAAPVADDVTPAEAPTQPATSVTEAPAPRVPVQNPVATRQPGSAGAEAAELNLLSTVMPVLVRRYAPPVIIAIVVIAGVWVWVATR
ncbi:SRPBCC family protein [Parafrigoribacterium mesophilum]|uniref:SRPBCC family protein n=1 Tax=Parafrigoribacterium mesophilum TaxID=433646 RepID=UPI0031FD0C12